MSFDIIGPLANLNNQLMRQREMEEERAREDAYRRQVFDRDEQGRQDQIYNGIVESITSGKIQSPDLLSSILSAQGVEYQRGQAAHELLKHSNKERKLKEKQDLALGETPAVKEGGQLVALSRLPGAEGQQAAATLENLRRTQRETFGEDFDLLSARQEAIGAVELENLRSQRIASQAELNRSRATLLSEQRRSADAESKRLAPMRDALANQVLALGEPNSDAYKSGLVDIVDQIDALSSDSTAKRRLLNEVMTVSAGMRSKGVAESVSREEKRGALYAHYKSEGMPDELASIAAKESASSSDGAPKTVFTDIEVTGLPVRAKDAESAAVQSMSSNSLASTIANFQALSELIAESNPNRLTALASRKWEQIGGDADPAIAALGTAATDLSFKKVVDVAASTFNQRTQDILSSQVPRTSQLAHAWDSQNKTLRGAYAARMEQLWQSLESEHLSGVPIRLRKQYSDKFQEFKQEQLRLARERNSALYGAEAKQSENLENELRRILEMNPQAGP